MWFYYWQALFRLFQSQQDLVTCLRTSRTDDVVEWCLLADHFSTPQKDVVNVQQLQTWWKKHVAVNSDQNMVSKLYLDLLARLFNLINFVRRKFYYYWLWMDILLIFTRHIYCGIDFFKCSLIYRFFIFLKMKFPFTLFIAINIFSH